VKYTGPIEPQGTVRKYRERTNSLKKKK
jgi:hypothetical protein